MSQHPDIAVCPAKEPEFYSHPSHLDLGVQFFIDGYRRDLDRGCSTILDCSVAYSQYPYRLDSSALIQRDFPDAKFVYLVRDPVERWISDYLHEMRHGVTKTPEDAFLTEPRMLAASRYGEQLQRYVDVFGRESILVLGLDELAGVPHDIARRIFDHCGLVHHDVSQPDASKINRGGVDHFVRHRTTSRLFNFPGGNRVRSALPDSVKQSAFRFVRSGPIGRRVEKSWPEPVFSEDLRERLAAAFADDLVRFRELSDVVPES